LIIAKRRAGKSILGLNLIKHLTDKYDYSCIILFSDTFEVENNKAFNSIDPKCCFHSNLIDEKIEKLINY
jgi:hypothetical protein